MYSRPKERHVTRSAVATPTTQPAPSPASSPKADQLITLDGATATVHPSRPAVRQTRRGRLAIFIAATSPPMRGCHEGGRFGTSPGGDGEASLEVTT